MNPAICLHCAHQNPAGANFCAQCGSPFQSSDPADYGRPLLNSTGVSSAIPASSTSSDTRRSTWKRLAVLSLIAIGIGAGISELMYLQWNHHVTEPERQNQVRVLAESTVKAGLLITRVESSSPADHSGLQPQDIVVEYAGRSVQDTTSYVDAVEAQAPDQRTVNVKVWREGKEVNLSAP